MKNWIYTKFLGTILIFAALASCQESNPRFEPIEGENLTTQQVDSILSQFKFEYEAPIIFDSSYQVMIPISTSILGKRRGSYSKSKYYGKENPRYWNALFYNRKTGVTQLLSEDKVRIDRFHVSSNNKAERKSSDMFHKVLYEIRDIDYNKDGKLDEQDPKYLFSSKNDGTELKRISPIGEDLQYFKQVPNSNQILIHTLRDVNKDSIYNKVDEFIWYNADLSETDWKLTEVIDLSGRDKIEKLYFEQWLKKDKE